MSRLTSGRYSEGELSDSPQDMGDDISLSLSDDDQNSDVLDIKPPQPQAGYQSRSSKSSKRERGYERRGNQDSRSMDRKGKDGKHPKEERKPDRKSDRREGSRDSRKEDLRERLERERRLRMGKEREEPPESRETEERRRSSGLRRDRQPEKIPKVAQTAEEPERQTDERHRRKKAEVHVISSPESDNQLIPEEEPEMEAEKDSSSLSDTSDEGEASSSSSTGSDDKASSPEVPMKSNGQHRSPTIAQDKESLDEGPESKRRKNEELTQGGEEQIVTIETTPVVEKEEFPPYLPAIMGCRSVGEFQCLNKIEEGTYGVVYRAQDKRTEEIVALKRLKMEREKEGFPITSLREVSTLLKAQHENIVTVREIVVGSNMDSIFMVMDYVEHDLKSLMEVLKSRKQFFLPGEVKCLLIQLLRAVAHLHDNWILHRDLKTSNILLSHSGILKVGDFGLAREYGSPLKAYTSVVVTLWYRAPELLLGVKEYSTPIDVWSVGCIFGELLTLEAIFQGKFEADQINKIFRELGTPNDNCWPGYSELPFVKKATFTNNPVSNLRKRFSSRLSELGVDLMQKFLTYDPQKRVTAEEALNHTYLKEPPFPIHPSMLPTWPAKSESHGPRKAQSPKPPSGGRAYKQLGDNDDAVDVDANTGFHMGGAVVDRNIGAVGPGFSLKF